MTPLERRAAFTAAVRAGRSRSLRFDAAAVVPSQAVENRPSFPTVAMTGYLRSLLELSKQIRTSLQRYVLPHVAEFYPDGSARTDALDARATRVRIAIAGGPGTGKSRLAAALGARLGLPVYPTDGLAPLGWSAASEAAGLLLERMASGILEGVAVPRALRKELDRSAARPVDVVIALSAPMRPQTPAQRAMQLGQDSVLSSVRAELEARGVLVIDDPAMPVDLAALVRQLPQPLAELANARTDGLEDIDRYIAEAKASLTYDVRPAARLAGLRTIDHAQRMLDLEVQAQTGMTSTQYKSAQQATRKDASDPPPQVQAIDVFHKLGPKLATELDQFIADQVKQTDKMTDATYGAVKGIVRKSIAQGLRPAETASAILAGTTDVSQQRAIIIANDSIGTFHAATAELEQADIGVTHYTWRAVNDIATRPAHRALDGTKQAWDSPPVTNPKTGARFHPGYDTHYYACRCVAIPIIPPIPGVTKGAPPAAVGGKAPPEIGIFAEPSLAPEALPELPPWQPPPAPKPPPPAAPPPPAVAPLAATHVLDLAKRHAPTLAIPAVGTPTPDNVLAPVIVDIDPGKEALYDRKAAQLLASHAPGDKVTAVQVETLITAIDGAPAARAAAQWTDAWAGKSTEKLAAEARAGLEKGASAQRPHYTATQSLINLHRAELEARGILDKAGYVTLYRGVNGQQETDVLEALGKSPSGVIDMRVRFTSSWTTAVHVARRFGSTILTLRVHYSRLFAVHYFEEGLADMAESEWIIATPEESVYVRQLKR